MATHNRRHNEFRPFESLCIQKYCEMLYGFRFVWCSVSRPVLDLPTRNRSICGSARAPFHLTSSQSIHQNIPKAKPTLTLTAGHSASRQNCLLFHYMFRESSFIRRRGWIGLNVWCEVKGINVKGTDDTSI